MAKKQKSDTSATSNNNRSIDDGFADKKTTKYVVVRDGYRVSDVEYDSANDVACISELQFWTKVSKTHSYGERVEVVPYDSKLHRVW